MNGWIVAALGALEFSFFIVLFFGTCLLFSLIVERIIRRLKDD